VVSGRQVPVTMPRARFVVDDGGRLDVTVDDLPWQPATTDPGAPDRQGGVPLGRSDVPWAQQQVANDLDTPVRVETVDSGRSRTDIVLPDGYPTTDWDSPDHSTGQSVHAPEPGPGSSGTRSSDTAPRHLPGEEVVIAAVVARTRADENGLVHFRQPPAALRGRTLLVHGETSGTTTPYDQLPTQAPPTRTGPRDGSTGASTPSRSPSVPDDGLRRRPDPRPAPMPSRPRSPESPDNGMGAL
jgi:hypothetical protein